MMLKILLQYHTQELLGKIHFGIEKTRYQKGECGGIQVREREHPSWLEVSSKQNNYLLQVLFIKYPFVTTGISRD
uniref:Uncharacterized protein n=1 Tax=Pararge aegeria TaxID=116150 RepID=S4NN56_9NEOP